MTFGIAATFPKSLEVLDPQDRERVKAAVFDFQLAPDHPSRQLHRLDKCRDKNLWSWRIDRDLRCIVYKNGGTTLLCYAGHHDRAYQWAENRQFVPNPMSGALQIVEVEERIEEVVRIIEQQRVTEPALFERFEPEYLMTLGVPERWLGAVRAAGESGLFTLVDRLPEEAAENLLRLADGELLPTPEPAPSDVDPVTHPDAMRRFRLVVGDDELRLALDAPMERWAVFLHPSQRRAVELRYGGPAKVTGGAGTGKTVVALHRAAWLVRANPEAEVLLTTYSRTLSARLEGHLDLLLESGTPERSRVTVENLHRLAKRMVDRGRDRPIQPLTDAELAARIERHARAAASGTAPGAVFGTGSATAFDPAVDLAFLRAEFTDVVDAQGIQDLAGYLRASRAGRGTPLPARARTRAWQVFGPLLTELEADGLATWSGICHAARRHLASSGAAAPFDHVVADEVQDLGPAELQLMRALAKEGPGDLFLTGDAGQRIYQAKTTFRANGIELVGRSSVLRVNYRTTEQIRRYADALLPRTLSGEDGEEESRVAVSLLAGPRPEVRGFAEASEEAFWLAERIERWLAAGLAPGDIAVFARTNQQLRTRAVAAAELAGVPVVALDDEATSRDGGVAVGTMHRAKGLEFRAVAIVGAEVGSLPRDEALRAQPDDAAKAAMLERERNLLYVACTRARERLVVTHVGRPSPFLQGVDRQPGAAPSNRT